MDITEVGQVQVGHGQRFGFHYCINLYTNGKLVDNRRANGFSTSHLAKQAGLQHRHGLLSRYGLYKANGVHHEPTSQNVSA